MGKRMVFGAMILSAAALPGPGAFAQGAAQGSQQQKAQPTKKVKMWTNDNIGSVLAPSDVYQQQESEKQKEAREANAAADKAAEAQKTAAKTDKTPSAPPALSNPKTVDSADGMIAWEQRDIDAQEQFVERLQKELETAPESQQAHIRARIQERMRAIESTKKEQQGLEAQKAALEKKAAEDGSANNGSGSNQK
jgi:hypothetical protein